MLTGFRKYADGGLSDNFLGATLVLLFSVFIDATACIVNVTGLYICSDPDVAGFVDITSFLRVDISGRVSSENLTLISCLVVRNQYSIAAYCCLDFLKSHQTFLCPFECIVLKQITHWMT